MLKKDGLTSKVCRETTFACLISGLKLIFHWKAQLLICSKSSFKLIPARFISCTTEKSEMSSAESLGFELKLLDKSLN